MPWFWSNRAATDDDEYEDEEYSIEGDEEEDDDDEDYTDDDEEYTDEDDEDESHANQNVLNDEEILPTAAATASATAKTSEQEAVEDPSPVAVLKEEEDSRVATSKPNGQHHRHQQTEATPPATSSLSNNNNNAKNNDNEEEEEATTLQDKQSLLILAAEHDRVDILQAILSASTASTVSSPSSSAAAAGNSSGSDSSSAPLPASQNHQQQQRAFLLNPVVQLPANHTATTTASDEDASSSGSSKNAGTKPPPPITTPESSKDTQNTGGGGIKVVATIPPLHIAVAYGSVHAVNALLRLGADPSLRPTVDGIQLYQQHQQQEQAQLDESSSNNNTSSHPEIPHIQRYDDCSAWELAFGSGGGTEDADDTNATSPSSWSLFGRSSSNNSVVVEGSSRSSTHQFHRRRRRTPVSMPPSKREGIFHAFTAEALRCMGSDDDVVRLNQLLESGLPIATEIGHKSLYEWAVDLGAVHCQKRLLYLASEEEQLQQQQQQQSETDSTTQESDIQGVSSGSSVRQSAVLDRRGVASGELSDIVALTNRLDELEALSVALSTCLDNLAEEVSVCAGLLLVGSGSATALATHVRSLKARKERKYDEWARLDEALENSNDELEYWIKQQRLEPLNASSCVIGDLLQLFEEVDKMSFMATNTSAAKPKPIEPSTTLIEKTNGTMEKGRYEQSESGSDPFDEAQQMQLQAQIGASENKIRRLRAAIADLSEENARNLTAVEQRGLSGGVILVRKLRDEIREIEYQFGETQRSEVACRAKIRLVQSKVKTTVVAKSRTTSSSSTESTEPVNESALENGESTTTNQPEDTVGDMKGDETDYDKLDMLDSERISRGQSRSIVVRGNNGPRGFLSFNIWQILLRIIGLNDGDRRTSGRVGASTTPAMII